MTKEHFESSHATTNFSPMIPEKIKMGAEYYLHKYSRPDDEYEILATIKFTK